MVALSVLALLVAGIVLASVSSGAERQIEVTATYPPRRDVKVVLSAGRVSVRTGAADEPIAVRRTERWSIGDGRPQVDAVDGQGGLELRGRCPSVISVSLGSGCAIDLDIVVPAGTRLTVETRSADVALGGTFDRLTARVAFGDVLLDRACATTLELQVAAGDADGRLRCAPTDGTVDVATGDVRLALPPGRYDLVAEAGLGSVSIWPGVVVDRGAKSALRLRSASGGVAVVP